MKRQLLWSLAAGATLSAVVVAQQRGAAAPPQRGGASGPRGAATPSSEQLPELAGAVAGVVVRAATGAPIKDATVTVLRVDGAAGDVIAANSRGGILPGGRGGAAQGAGAAGASGARTVQTDAKGIYTLSGLAPGQYRVRAAATGFISQGHGQQYFDAPGTPVSVAAGGSVRVDFQLRAGGVIEGAVFDEEGAPMPGSRVQLFAAGYGTGQLLLSPGQTVQSNGEGEYRISGVEPGEYYVTATPPAPRALLPSDRVVPRSAGAPRGRGGNSAANEFASQPRAYPATFFPAGADVKQATPIQMNPGGESHAVNITLRPVSLVFIRGTIVVPSVLPSPPPQPSINPQPAAGPRTSGPGGAAVLPAGPAGPPGPAGRGSGPGRGGARGGGNPAANVSIQLIPLGFGASPTAGPVAQPAAGRFNGGTVGTVGTAGAAGGAEIARVSSGPDGTFQIENVVPGSYTLFASTRVNDVPLTAFGHLDVSSNIENYALSLRQGLSVPGQIFLDGQAPRSDRTEMMEITLTPADGIPVNVVQMRASLEGSFRLEGVPPGRYRVGVDAAGGVFAQNGLFGGVDALNDIVQIDSEDVPLQLWIGFAQGRIDAVAEQSARPFPNARVLLVPAERSRLDLFRIASADKNGQVSFLNVPPGSYKLFAWESMARTHVYRNPGFLEPFESQGRPVSVGNSGVAFESHLAVLPAVQ